MNAPTESVTRAADVPPGPAPHESAFQQVVGRLPNGAERARFDAIRNALRLRDDDAVWTLFVALEYYLNLYERFPAMIRGAARELLIECKNESDRHIAHAKQQVQHRTDAAAVEVAQAAVAAHASLEKTIQQAARRIALAAGFATRWPWVLGGAAAMALVVILAGTIALGFGRQQGYAAGYTAGFAVAMQPQRPSDRPTVPPTRGR